MKRIVAAIFVALCVLSVSAQNSKLSPLVRQAMMSNKAESTVSQAKSVYGRPQTTMPTITAFVRTTDTDVLRQEGCSIYAQ